MRERGSGGLAEDLSRNAPDRNFVGRFWPGQPGRGKYRAFSYTDFIADTPSGRGVEIAILAEAEQNPRDCHKFWKRASIILVTVASFGRGRAESL